jgi:hypothetical protein
MNTPRPGYINMIGTAWDYYSSTPVLSGVVVSQASTLLVNVIVDVLNGVMRYDNTVEIYQGP